MDGPDSLCSDDEYWQPELRLQSFGRYTLHQNPRRPHFYPCL